MGQARGHGVALGVLVALLGGLILADPARADERFKATLQGYSEVPAVSSEARGEFRARISGDTSYIDYDLSYEDLEGEVTQSHIHFGQRGVSGGIAVWLCQTTANPAPAAVAMLTPTCPPAPGKVSGRITAGNVIGPAGQGIAVEEFAELVKAIRAGVAYANVHSRNAGGVTGNFNGGEIRGQISDSRDRRDDRD